MEFTEKQLQQINDLVLRHKFCTLETQQKLQAAGFFEKVRCNLHLCIFSNVRLISKRYKGKRILSIAQKKPIFYLYKDIPKKCSRISGISKLLDLFL